MELGFESRQRYYFNLIYINWLDSRSDKAEVPDSSSGVRTMLLYVNG